MREPKQAVVFSRVSSADQRDGFSLMAQSDMAKEYAKTHKLKIVKTWEVDESASKESDRKHFFAMVEFIKANNVKDVIFDKVDRACRGFESAQVLEALVAKQNVRFHFTRDRLIIDQDSPPQERLRLTLGMALAKYYIDNLKHEIHKGLKARLEAGHCITKPPVGYVNRKEGGSRRSTAVLDEKYAEAVKKIFELYATGNYSFDQLCEQLNEKSDEKKFTKRVVEGLISNPFYYGVLYHKGVIVGKGAHKPLVDKKVWDACQKIRGIRAAQNLSGNTGPTIEKPLMGLITCGVCSHAVTGEVKYQKRLKYIYYHCANHGCLERRKNTRQEVLMEGITRAFEPFQKFTPRATEAFLKAMQDRLEDLDLYTQQEAGKLAEKRLEIRKKLGEADRLHAKGLLSKNEYQEVLKLRQIALAQIDNEIDSYMSADRKTFEKGRRVIETFHKAYSFMALEGNDLKKIELVKLVLSNLRLKAGTLEYDYQKPFDVLIEMVGVPVWWVASIEGGVIWFEYQGSC